MQRYLILCLTLMVCWLSSCEPETESQTDGASKAPKQTLRLGLVPFESGDKLIRDIQPLLEVIEKGMEMDVDAKVAADYTGVVEAFKNGQLDAAFLSPASYVLAHQEAGVHVLVKSFRNGSANYYGAIIVRNDSPFKELADLKNKRFSFGDPLSTSGHIFARKMFLEAGVNPDTDFENVIYSGSHDATILSVLNGKVDGGATYADDNEGKSNAWKRFLKPEEQDEIRVLKYTKPIPADNICVGKDLDPKLVERLRKTILDFSNSPEGTALLQKLYHFEKYVPATDEDYRAVREGFEAAGINLKEKLQKK